MFTQNALMAETGKLQKFSLRLTKNKADADDLFQSTCLRALEKSHYFEDGTNLFSWTSKIMFNIFVSGYRRRTKFESRLDPEIFLDRQSVAPVQEIGLELADVQRAMMKLSAQRREILVMICVNGMSYEEVSVKLKIPVGTVRSRLSRAREQLKSFMEESPMQVMGRKIALKKSANVNIPAYIACQALQKRA